MVIVECDNKTDHRDTAYVDGRGELGSVVSSGGNLMLI